MELACVDCTVGVEVVCATVDEGVLAIVVVVSADDESDVKEEDAGAEAEAEVELTAVVVGTLVLLGTTDDSDVDTDVDIGVDVEETADVVEDDAPVLKFALLFCRFGKTPSGKLKACAQAMNRERNTTRRLLCRCILSVLCVGTNEVCPKKKRYVSISSSISSTTCVRREIRGCA